MTSRRIFEICNVIHLTVGGNTEHKLPFGGEQVVLAGEFFQLRPVPNQFDDGQFSFVHRCLDGHFLIVISCLLKKYHFIAGAR